LIAVHRVAHSNLLAVIEGLKVVERASSLVPGEISDPMRLFGSGEEGDVVQVAVAPVLGGFRGADNRVICVSCVSGGVAVG
jgi:hypothetical protein